MFLPPLSRGLLELLLIGEFEGGVVRVFEAAAVPAGALLIDGDRW